jgi:hypothetical protein
MKAADSASAAASALLHAAQSSPWPALRMAACTDADATSKWHHAGLMHQHQIDLQQLIAAVMSTWRTWHVPPACCM